MKKIVFLLFSFFYLANIAPSFSKPPCFKDIKISSYTNCVGEDISNGMYYRGEFLSGKAHGIGELRISNSRWHRGEFSNDLYNGLGAEYSGNQNSILIGEWKKGKLIIGLAHSKYGFYYGKWKNKKFHGEGIFINSNNEIQIGFWEDGKFKSDYLSKESKKNCKKLKKKNNCFLLLKSDDGEVSLAFIKNKLINGLGYWRTKNNIHKFGYFKNNQNIGNGGIINKNEYFVYGKMQNFLPNGLGITVSIDNKKIATSISKVDNKGFLYGNGFVIKDRLTNEKFQNLTTYFGNLDKGVAQGIGLNIGTKGDFYYGNWLNDAPSSEGIIITENKKYAGQMKNGKKEGIGLLYKKNKEVMEAYTGEFKNDKFHGEGHVFKSDSNTFNYGVWNDGKLVQNKKKFDQIKLDRLNQYSGEIKTLLRYSTFNLNNKFKQNLVSKKDMNKAKNTSINFPNTSIQLNFKKINKKPFDIAVIIGNANYEKQGKDIPNVNPAYADAKGINNYFTKALGIKEGNIIYLEDATAAQLLGTFGDSSSHKGKLYNWIKPNVSNVYIYYAGHGVPGDGDGKTYLVPSDADAQTIQFSGYPLSTLYSNLGKLPAKSVTVILEACFSGISQSGNLFKKSSRMIITPKQSLVPKNVKVIAAGSPSQMASWEEDNSHSLFTKYFLKAMSGEADKNKDGEINDNELKDYLDETMTYFARRYYGRDQKVQIIYGK